MEQKVCWESSCTSGKQLFPPLHPKLAGPPKGGEVVMASTVICSFRASSQQGPTADLNSATSWWEHHLYLCRMIPSGRDHDYAGRCNYTSFGIHVKHLQTKFYFILPFQRPLGCAFIDDISVSIVTTTLKGKIHCMIKKSKI